MNQTSRVISRTVSIDEGVIVKLSGDIDLSRSPALRGQIMTIAQDEHPRICLDMTEVTFMDSSGIAVLMELIQRQREHAGRLILFGLQDRVKRMFEEGHLTMLFDIAADAEAAQKI
ncbi:MAG: anti-sigma factor antagonist [Phycisphaera sp.]|nr:anti-sigma factor antagonist [Phycisphaera sp.]